MSRRQVPLHPDLWEIGLQDYIDDLRSIGATRLFPTLPANKNGKRERRMSHDGNEYLKLGFGKYYNKGDIFFTIASKIPVLQSDNPTLPFGIPEISVLFYDNGGLQVYQGE